MNRQDSLRATTGQESLAELGGTAFAGGIGPSGLRDIALSILPWYLGPSVMARAHPLRYLAAGDIATLAEIQLVRSHFQVHKAR